MAMAMAASVENGSLRSVSAPVANGLADAIQAEFSQNGGLSAVTVLLANGGGDEDKKEGLTGRKAKEAERRRRRRSKKKKPSNKKDSTGKADESEDDVSDKENADENEEKVEVEYVSEKPDFGDANGFMDPLMEDFQRIFDKFVLPETLSLESTKNVELEEIHADEPKKKGSDDSDDSDESDDEKDKEKGLSNKKKKLQRRMKIAELKQQCMKPDVVEVWDATAADPRLLVFLKGYRNTVPVPRHWCQKRKFLQGAVHHHV